jgi:hypothetical protein
MYGEMAKAQMVECGMDLTSARSDDPAVEVSKHMQETLWTQAIARKKQIDDDAALSRVMEKPAVPSLVQPVVLDKDTYQDESQRVCEKPAWAPAQVSKL